MENYLSNHDNVFIIVSLILIVLVLFVIKNLVHQNSIRKNHRHHKRYPGNYFMKRIGQGFRVYDAYIAWPILGNGPDSEIVKFSILSKKPIDQCYIETYVSEHCYGVIKNKHSKYCRYITYNGKDIYEFNNKTGKSDKPKEIYFERNITRYYSNSKWKKIH